MDEHVFDHFSIEGSTGSFHDVIPLHSRSDMPWSTVIKMIPELPRGWYELAHLHTADRLEFTAEHWLLKLPFHPSIEKGLALFFDSLDDIGVFLYQETSASCWNASMIFSLKENGGYFQGNLPATEQDCAQLQALFPEWFFPSDYFAFLQMHNGMQKSTDKTGIIHSFDVEEAYERLQNVLLRQERMTTRQGKNVDPQTLIPFYESFGMPFFQCFWAEWHHELGMGNVYYSITDKMISEPGVGTPGSDNMAFPTFTEWLMFYLEPVR